VFDDGCGGETDCGECPNSDEVCHEGRCCVPDEECSEDQCGLVDDGCGGTLQCPEPDACGRCVVGRYGDDAYAESVDFEGCEQPTGPWDIHAIWGPSTGSCQLSASLRDSLDLIETSWWGETYMGPNPDVTGSHNICDDGCSVEWDMFTPLTGGVSGTCHEHVELRMMTATLIQGTFAITHDRNDGLECTVVADVTLTKL